MSADMRKLIETVEQAFNMNKANTGVSHEEFVNMLENKFEMLSDNAKRVFDRDLRTANFGFKVELDSTVPSWREILDIFEDTRDASQVRAMLRVIKKHLGIAAVWNDETESYKVI